MVASLAHLSSDVLFVLGLEKIGVGLIIADMPTATRMELALMTMAAEAQANALAIRTASQVSAVLRRANVTANDEAMLEAAD